MRPLGDTAQMSVWVWVEGWQMECCGESFRIGSTVSWTLTETDPELLETILGEERAAEIPFTEEHHGTEPEARVKARSARSKPFSAASLLATRRGPWNLVPLPGQA
jgi:hypothetical protein